MKVIAINGSPRKNWNTHILLKKALEGARDAGAETEMYMTYSIRDASVVFHAKSKRGRALVIVRQIYSSIPKQYIELISNRRYAKLHICEQQ